MSNGYGRYFRLGINPTVKCDVKDCKRTAIYNRELCGLDGFGIGKYKFVCKKHWSDIVNGHFVEFKE